MAEVYFRSVREVAVSDYALDQVLAWAPERPAPGFFEEYASDGRLVLVAVDTTDRVVAYTDVERDGHIDHLYRHPDATGMGVATMLFLTLEESARASGMKRLFVEASEPARRFLQRHGFGVVGRRDFEINGVSIHNYEMEKRLE